MDYSENDIHGWQALEEKIVACRRCPRLVAWREEVARTRRRAYREQEYWGRPVPGFGDHNARILVVGLAPGAHGANRTGRLFTGDSSGEFLFAALHRAGLANQPTAVQRDDGLALHDVYIGAVCRCAPPDNRPTQEEIAHCLPYLEAELAQMARLQVIVALGRIAFDWLLRLYLPAADGPRPAFAHGAAASLGAGRPWLVSSYHPSRQNTQTRRLSAGMFDEVWAKAKALLVSGSARRWPWPG